MKSFDDPSRYDGKAYGIVISGHFNEPDTYVTRRTEGMSDWLVTLTQSGAGYMRTPSGETLCRPGDVALLCPGVPHQYGTVPGGRWQFMWAHFSPRLMETGLLPEAEVLLHHADGINEYKRFHRAFRRIISDSIERSPYWQELCEMTIREILLLLAQALNKQTDPRIRETLRYLSEHMKEPIRIDTLAQSVSLSPSRLSHLFKAQTGFTILEALNRMRVQQAALLLTHTDRTALEVSFDVGFHNYNHFANQFRKVFGIAPSKYKGAKN
ncbi:AraC family transcriptional regulator, arabinose operon regulatory protein [Paenibacillus sp. UNCCL117]|uniref:helix-turn-helix domain-containing protein n=1 Tax=unclassified Paenibacillus TaxID=185978 RepID=UPI000887FEFE|nr:MULTISPECIES: helix-turn-helix domain-containing protein [unclassified Paenibacillus]SDD37775.1 AraC family transcriptional regulator, arabinose operon regulatory protein [Paenibacillus sp. cl123]SFW48720.1 AraC family transcriptional regulator, arabinose operon regulatory protein [Paenibacillus sp. UNCCL117]